MTWKDVVSKIAEIAPIAGTLATPLLGPAGPLAGAAIKALAGAFGITSPDPQPDQVMAALQTAGPEAVLKLQLAVQEFKTEEMRLQFQERENIRKAELEELKTVLFDVQNARQRQVESEKATGHRDINLYVLAYMFIIGFFVSIIIMTWLTVSGKIDNDLPQAAVFLLGSLFGTLTAGVGAIIQYFFGTNKSSAEKNQMLFNSMPISAMPPGSMDKRGK